MQKLRIAIVLLALGGAFAGAGEAKRDILDTAVAAGNFTTLVKAVGVADLEATLRGKGPFTVFAPNDAAFAALPPGALDALLKDTKTLKSVLGYHVVPGRLTSKELAAAGWLTTAQGQSLRAATEGGTLRIDGAKLIASDIEATNGIVHVLDRVVLPRKDLVDTAIDAKNLKTLVAAVKAAGLVETLRGSGPFTVFAPTDEAFAALPEGALDGLLKNVPALTSVLTYHVIPGRLLSTDLKEGTHKMKTVEGREITVVKAKDGAVTVDGARVGPADVIAGNGVLHVLDRVAMPGQ
jgi:uncharacterized surface protein with fasciclin (FAS1) repeats